MYVTCSAFVLLMSRGRRGQGAACDLLSKQNRVCTQKKLRVAPLALHTCLRQEPGLNQIQTFLFLR